MSCGESGGNNNAMCIFTHEKPFPWEYHRRFMARDNRLYVVKIYRELRIHQSNMELVTLINNIRTTCRSS